MSVIEDLALAPVAVNFLPGAEYAERRRRWQGVSAIERAPNGRLWAAWYSGGTTEDENNYVLLVTSDDDGRRWTEPVLVIDPPGKIRACDPCLWHDPLGRLWLFWMQNESFPTGGMPYDGRGGVWFIRTDNASVGRPVWTAPRRIWHGTMLNKPIVLSTGEWMLTCAVKWDEKPFHHSLPEEQFSNVVVTCDRGETFARRGSADVPKRDWDEHMVVERRDGSLWMFVRRLDGIGAAVSKDRGRTWQASPEAILPGPCARFHLRRLRSGRLLLINHHQFTGRSHLTAFLSEDDGATWPHHLLLDERANVSYPDTVETPEGRLWVIYDRCRLGEGEILLQSLTEEDILHHRAPGYAGGRLQVISRVHRLNLGSKPAPLDDDRLVDYIRNGVRAKSEAGHAPVRFSDERGELATLPFWFTGSSLYLDVSVSPTGCSRVELQDFMGRPVKGYTMEECTEIRAGKTPHKVCWKAGHDLSAFAGQLVRLRMTMNNAELFSFQFGNTDPEHQDQTSLT